MSIAENDSHPWFGSLFMSVGGGRPNPDGPYRVTLDSTANTYGTTVGRQVVVVIPGGMVVQPDFSGRGLQSSDRSVLAPSKLPTGEPCFVAVAPGRATIVGKLADANNPSNEWVEFTTVDVTA